MPLVTITAQPSDHGIKVMPAALQQRFWLVPNEGHLLGNRALDNQPVLADFTPGGTTLTAQVWSEPGNPRLWYTLRTDWLRPGQELRPPPELSQGYYEWPVRIFPDTGGPIGDLIDPNIATTGLVWCSPTAPDSSVRAQLQFNMTTKLLYERQVRW